MANEDQREDWNGQAGQEWSREQDRYDRMLASWGRLLEEVAQVAEGEHALDLGCGCGATTLAAATRAGATGRALGVDLSAPMVARARQRAEAAGLANVEFRVGDCQADDLGTGTHDVAMSRFGAMFFDDPVAAFANVARSVRPGGRLALLTWAPVEQQQWLVVPGAAAMAHVPFPDVGAPSRPGMFGLSQADRIMEVLAGAGWSGIEVEAHTRPLLLGGGGTLDETMAFLVASGPGRALLEGADEQAGARAIAAIREALAEYRTPDGYELTGTSLAITATL